MVPVVAPPPTSVPSNERRPIRSGSKRRIAP